AGIGKVVPKLIGIVRQPAVVRLMPGLGSAWTGVLTLFLLVRRRWLRRGPRRLIGPLKLEHQFNQLLFAQFLQITAIHAPMDSEIGRPGKGRTEIRRLAPIRAPKLAVGNYLCKINRRPNLSIFA